MGLSKFLQRRALKDESSSSLPSVASTSTLPPPSPVPARRGIAVEPTLDEDVIPTSEAAARLHISSIRSEKGLDGPESNSADLQAALVVLSEQLYQKSTHFLLELVQNADDNYYAASTSTPTLNITYQDRTLRIDCNEIGFSKKNVAAICRIGRSSKTGLDNTRRYIGEKGIGFKSVFKIADIVWIKSGHYSFRFDKSQRLGMIAPEWKAFPFPALPGYTSILLQLSEQCDDVELIREIKGLDANLLIFLQKLKHINISIKELHDLPWMKSLVREDATDRLNGQQIVTLRHRTGSSAFRIFRRRVDNLPPDTKRPGITRSEILLAFPIAEDKRSKLRSQNVYAFLPIRDYGFRFLLQADFLVIASREDIDSSSAWNNALRAQIPGAIHRAIKELNNGDSRYSWLPYIPVRHHVADFFKHIEDDTLQLLSDSPILESFSGVLAAPSQLIQVPEAFTDKDGKPLILTSHTRPRYVSNKYPPEDLHYLQYLGVQNQSIESFVYDLRRFVLDHPDEFRSQSNQWHSRLAEVLLSHVFRDKGLHKLLSKLEIVPLRDGRWASSQNDNIFFPAKSDYLVVPNGLDILEVHPDAYSDFSRQQLFRALGAKDFRADIICDIIIKTQESTSFDPHELPLRDLISHVIFLYQAGWRNPKRHDIWFATDTGYCRCGSGVYMDSNVPYSARSMFEKFDLKPPFLHPSYYTAFSEIPPPRKLSKGANESWQEWLTQNLHLAHIPRIATPSHDAPFTLPGEFQSLLTFYGSSDVLLMLKTHWDYYARWIVEEDGRKLKSAWEQSQKDLRAKIATLDVKCRPKSMQPLGKTFLPLANMHLDSIMSVPFLDVPDPDDDQWAFLSYFNVVVRVDATFFLHCLQRLQDKSPSVKQISALYAELDRLTTSENVAKVRHIFETHRLIYIPGHDSDHPGVWERLEDCVWSGPKSLKRTACLITHYPERYSFFRDVLRLRDADLQTLVTEARKMIPSDGEAWIAQLLIDLSKFLEDTSSTPVVKPLAECYVFPVTTRAESAGFDGLQTALNSSVWFIADRNHLKQSFEGMVPLLAFNLETIEAIMPLVKILNLEDRLLSRVAKGVSKPDGQVSLHNDYTASLRKKSRCIARIVPKNNANLVKTFHSLHNVEVYQSEKVIVEWIVKSLTGETKYGRAESGRVALDHTKDTLKLYMRAEDITAGLPPLELQEELAKFVGISDAKHVMLLLYILMQDDISVIEDTLQRRGISNELPEFDQIAGLVKPEKTEPMTVPRRQPTQSDTANSRLRFRRRPRPHFGEQASQNVAAFIDRFERVTIMKKKDLAPWSPSDAAGLLAKICEIEHRDAAPFLPQIETVSSEVADIAESALPRSRSAITFEGITSWQRRMSSSTKSRIGGEQLSGRRASVFVSDELQFLAELSVSRMLEQQMGPAYSPQMHWTSILRGQAGHAPFDDIHRNHCTFTIGGNTDALTELLVSSGYNPAALWKPSPVYHIQVVGFNEGVDSQFLLESAHVQKFRKRSIIDGGGVPPTNICLMVLVHDIQTKPIMSLLVDPWKVHVNGQLSLEASGYYLAAVKDLSAAIVLSRASIHPIRSHSTQDDGAQSATEAATGSYSYQELQNNKEIRLFELAPGTEETPLSGKMHHVPVGTSEKYWAISYVWGAALKPFNVHTPQGVIDITLSLYDALRGIRDAKTSTMIWVDALCIDQDNNLEKSVQIRLLPKIFRSAESVIAWLGEAKDNSHQAIDTLMQIRLAQLKPDVWPEDISAIPVSWMGRDLPPVSDRIWRDIDRFLDREWFHRAWIVQEVILASNVVLLCGEWSLPWDDFFDALKICRQAIKDEQQSLGLQYRWLKHDDAAFALGMKRHAKMMFDAPLLGAHSKMLNLLEHFWYTTSTRKLDKLFALLGLASDCGSPIFNPDYDSSEEVVLRRYACQFVRAGQALDLMYRAGSSRSYPFASWIPNWTNQRMPRTISSWQSNMGVFSAGGKHEPCHAEISDREQKKLSITGLLFDHIVEIGPNKRGSTDVLSFISSIRSSIEKGKGGPYTAEARQNIKLELPIGAAKRPHLTNKNSLDIESGSSDGHLWPEKLSKLLPSIATRADMTAFFKSKPRSEREVAFNYWQTATEFADRLGNATFCRTSKGYLGLVPGDVQVGDEVAIFKGGAVPFVFRKNEGEDSCRLIGEAYIYGIMHGEALELKSLSGKKFNVV